MLVICDIKFDEARELADCNLLFAALAFRAIALRESRQTGCK